MKILITGGTGFIGKKVIGELLDTAEMIYVLVRPQSVHKLDYLKNNANVKLIEGDILENDVISNVYDLVDLCRNITAVLHLAAKYDLEMSDLDAYTYNVIGVQNILTLSKRFKKLEYFHHISSYSAAGPIKGPVYEDEVADIDSYTDHYARSKMQGEQVLRSMDLGDVKKRIYRPGITIGSTEDGEIEKIDGPYYLLKFVYENQELLKHVNKLGFFPFPFEKNSTLPVISVNILACWLAQSVTKPNPTNEVRAYHFLGQENILLEDFIGEALKLYGINVPLLGLKNNPTFKYILPKIGMPKELISYMYLESEFDVSNRKTDFPQHQEVNIDNMTKKLTEGCNKYFMGLKK
jgi:nucleoside-diphosphate-sugar epimerase